MGSKNQYIVQQAAALTNPLAFAASVDDSGITRDNLDLILDMLALEGTDMDQHRLFIDKMSPAARTSMYAIIKALRDVTTDV